VTSDRVLLVPAGKLLRRVSDSQSQVNVLSEAHDVDDSSPSDGRDIPTGSTRRAQQAVKKKSGGDTRPKHAYPS
jgi:hypothetical protein